MRPRAVAAALVLAVPAVVAVSAYAGSSTVTIKDDLFAPKTLSIARGTTVKWVWKGTSAHNVTVKSGPTRFNSPTRTTGTYSRKLTRAGTYRLYCTIHGPRQSMTIKVK
jgi:plastocyanin